MTGAEHWMHRQLRLGERLVDRAGSHPGELEVEGFPLGAEVRQAGYSSPFQVVGYYRGNVVLKEAAHGTTHKASPGDLEVV